MFRALGYYIKYNALGTAASVSFGFQIFNHRYSGAGNLYVFAEVRQTNGSNVFSPNSVGTGISKGSWHHIVVIADGSNLLLYIDSIKSSSVSYNGTIDTISADSKFIVSSCNYDNDVRSDHYSDEVGFWKDITFSSDWERDSFVQGLWNEGRGRFWNGSNWDVEFSSSSSSSSF